MNPSSLMMFDKTFLNMSYQVYKEYLENYHNNMASNKTFIVAYISLHVGVLTQEVVYAKSELEAANAYLDANYSSMEEVDEFMAASDSWISVLEFNNTLTE
jgi:hypothetical protein